MPADVVPTACRVSLVIRSGAARTVLDRKAIRQGVDAVAEPIRFTTLFHRAPPQLVGDGLGVLEAVPDLSGGH
jgi:hypothetical protein